MQRKALDMFLVDIFKRRDSLSEVAKVVQRMVKCNLVQDKTLSGHMEFLDKLLDLATRFEPGENGELAIDHHTAGALPTAEQVTEYQRKIKDGSGTPISDGWHLYGVLAEVEARAQRYKKDCALDSQNAAEVKSITGAALKARALPPKPCPSEFIAFASDWKPICRRSHVFLQSASPRFRSLNEECKKLAEMTAAAPAQFRTKFAAGFWFTLAAGFAAPSSNPWLAPENGPVAESAAGLAAPSSNPIVALAEAAAGLAAPSSGAEATQPLLRDKRLKFFTSPDSAGDLFIDEAEKRGFAESLQARAAVIECLSRIEPVMCRDKKPSAEANTELSRLAAQFMPRFEELRKACHGEDTILQQLYFDSTEVPATISTFVDNVLQSLRAVQQDARNYLIKSYAPLLRAIVIDGTSCYSLPANLSDPSVFTATALTMHDMLFDSVQNSYEGSDEEINIQESHSIPTRLFKAGPSLARLAQRYSEMRISDALWPKLFSMITNVASCAESLHSVVTQLACASDDGNAMCKVVTEREKAAFKSMVRDLVTRANDLLMQELRETSALALTPECNVLEALTSNPPMKKCDLMKLWKTAGAKKLNNMFTRNVEAKEKHASMINAFERARTMAEFMDVGEVKDLMQSIQTEADNEWAKTKSAIANLAVVQAMNQTNSKLNKDDLRQAAQLRIEELGVILDPAVATYFGSGA